MKNKFLILFIGIISFLGISDVKADNIAIMSQFYNDFDEALNVYENYSDIVNYLINYWEENYSSSYNYYYITKEYYSLNNNIYSTIVLYTSNSRYVIHHDQTYYGIENVSASDPIIAYNITSDSYETIGMFPYLYSSNYQYVLLKSNASVYKSSSYFDGIQIPAYTSNTSSYSFSQMNISAGEKVPGLLELIDGSYSSSIGGNYTKIDLNDYSYVALSLKDYSNTEEFTTNVYVKGQYCLTPVYNYGMTERKDILSGSTIERCSPVYNDFTLVRTYILENDIKNNAIYYLKAYDTSHDNIVRVDSSIFDITYITSQNEDNPYITVGGKSYPAIAYDDLTDSATISEENNYVSGASCALGDINCVSSVTGQSFTFSDIFTNPLQMLKDVWSAIIKVFELITMLISLLPPVLQTFLYLSFMLAIILGLIKILL